MSWIKGKRTADSAGTTKGETKAHVGAHVARHAAAHISLELEQRLAEFLIAHERLTRRPGRPLMHLLGVSPNAHDGSTDYAMRSRVRDDHGLDQRFDSTIRIFASGHMRLIR